MKLKNLLFCLSLLSTFTPVTKSLAEELTPEQQQVIDESFSATARLERIVRENLPTKYLKIHVDETSVVDDKMKTIFNDYGFDPAVEGFDVLIGIVNDHNAYAMGLIKERGDDFGYTHGAVIEIGTKIQSKYHLKFKYSTDLYTQPIDGEKIDLKDDNFTVRQHLTNENITRFVLDNYDEGKLYFWKAELGWHKLDHRPDDNNFLLASTQQLRYHRLLNSIKPGMNMIPTNLYDGQPSREGILAGFFMGTRQIFTSDSGKFRLKFEEVAGVEYSDATNTLYQHAEASGKLTFQKAPHELAFEIGAGVSVNKHEHGTQYTPFVDLGIGRARMWRIGVRAEYYKGDLNNDSGYNVINSELGYNDPTAKIYYQYFTN